MSQRTFKRQAPLVWEDERRVDDVLVHDPKSLQVVLERVPDENRIAVDEVLEEFFARLSCMFG